MYILCYMTKDFFQAYTQILSPGAYFWSKGSKGLFVNFLLGEGGLIHG